MTDEVTREQVLDALRRFDRELRVSPQRVNSDKRPPQFHSVVHGGRAYPAEKIVAMATGAPDDGTDDGGWAADILADLGFYVVPLREPAGPLIWWANQGGLYAAARDAGAILTPQRDSLGNVPGHWRMLSEVCAGDVIVACTDRAVRALAYVTSNPTEVDEPWDGAPWLGYWKPPGWRVDVTYHELRQPIPLERVAARIRALDISHGPLTTDQTAQSAYLRRFSHAGLRILRDASAEPWPAWAEEAMQWVEDDTAAAPAPVQEPTSSRRIVKIAPGENARLWEECRAGGYICVGWEAVGDLRHYPSQQDFLTAFRIDYPANGTVSANSLWGLLDLRPGDLVVANRGKDEILGVGEVVAPGYVWRPDRAEYNHTVAVRWDTGVARKVPVQNGWVRTIVPVTPEQYEELIGPAPAPAPAAPEEQTVSYTDLLRALEEEGLAFAPETVSNYLLALQTKRFVILTGISGTGKTQLALAVARAFQPRVRVTRAADVPANAVDIEVRDYMTRYAGLVLPVALSRRLILPPFRSGSTSGDIAILYPRGKTRLNFRQDPHTSTVELSLRRPFREWFAASFKPGDHVLLEAIEHEGEAAHDLRFSLPRVETREEVLDNSLVVAVRPDWTDHRGLLGYHNPLTGEYARTPFLDLLLRAAAEEEAATAERRAPRPFFAILDEMNLARVEHYFADFLSALESGEPLHLHDDERLEQGEGDERAPVPRDLPIPANLFVTGTVNVDETTYLFSPKVLDRAFTIEFTRVDLRAFGRDADGAGGGAAGLELTDFPGVLRHERKPDITDWDALGALDEGLRETVVALHELLVPEGRHFGYRVAAEIARFVVLASEQAGREPATLRAALDLALLEKVLPKFHGTQQELEAVLAAMCDFAIHGARRDEPNSPEALLEGWRPARDGALAAVVADDDTVPAPVLPRTAAKLWGMLRRLRQQGFASFIE
ncbi:MAG TPA: hypothetical protein VFL91_04265 [Thermomicrobiales bacterium]|nr:hypothetical protein [Thermomicrobiales bacterium]